jgi:hypothetical protein
MSKTGNSKYFPQNTSVFIPEIKAEAELFWQTKNANHLLENYRDNISHFGKEHDLKFNDFPKLLRGNVSFGEEKNRKTKYAIAFNQANGKYYYIAFTIEKRFRKYFILIVTAYATKKSHHIKEQQEVEEFAKRVYKGL